MKGFFISIIAFYFFTMQTDFLSDQKRYKRVRHAIEKKGSKVKAHLLSKHLNAENLNILFVSYKKEQELEIYAKTKQEDEYSKIATYDICRASGKLGPKRKQGDYQVPEGFYFIDRFNPASNFYLSLGLNYPNKSDKIKSTAKDPGGDIFIHGSCVTVGCMPMTDDKIMEIYLYAVYAKNNGQKEIPVYSFPFKMNDANFKAYSKVYKNNIELLNFWSELKIGYDSFMECKTELKVKIDQKGKYIF